MQVNLSLCNAAGTPAVKHYQRSVLVLAASFHVSMFKHKYCAACHLPEMTCWCAAAPALHRHGSGCESRQVVLHVAGAA
jgi:DTW domain-containing protein YfiP